MARHLRSQQTNYDPYPIQDLYTLEAMAIIQMSPSPFIPSFSTPPTWLVCHHEPVPCTASRLSFFLRAGTGYNVVLDSALLHAIFFLRHAKTSFLGFAAQNGSVPIFVFRHHLIQ
mmetsp:Transcript_8352/g.13507  ORF Transcript_8352/g.13507 Transcript_8352/m.13507 type:complete len:115 (+) Transcript_8352:1362-1706(+)